MSRVPCLLRVALLLGLLSFVAGCDDDPKKTTPTDDVVDDTAADTVTDVTTTDTTVTDAASLVLQRRERFRPPAV